jgi:ligand-binding sensor domain-containing protein
LTQKKYFTKIYLPEDKNTRSIKGVTVMGIEQVDDSTLLIGTIYGGINIFNINTNKFFHILENDGLPENKIYSIKKESSGFIWFTTDYGLYKFKFDDKKFIRYNIEPGLINSSFQQTNFYVLKNGQWITNTSTEIICFNPIDNNIQTGHTSAVEIAGFKIYDKAFSIDSLLKKITLYASITNKIL